MAQSVKHITGNSRSLPVEAIRFTDNYNDVAWFIVTRGGKAFIKIGGPYSLIAPPDPRHHEYDHDDWIVYYTGSNTFGVYSDRAFRALINLTADSDTDQMFQPGT